jgi:hypothetical protein
VASSLLAPIFPRIFDDLEETSSGENAVSRVSGVPLKESAPPWEDRGEDGWKLEFGACAISSPRR